MTTATQLAVVRILFFSLQYLFMARWPYFRLWADVPIEFWHPNGLTNLISDPQLWQSWIPALVLAWQTSFVFVILGLGYKWIAPINVILGFAVVNFSQSFGATIHPHFPVVLASFPLAFAPASACYSLDSWFRKINALPIAEVASKQALFNVRLISCLVYFSAGLSKLINGGWQWIAGDSLRYYFISAPLNSGDINAFARSLSINTILFEWPNLCKILAALVVLIEILCPLALLGGLPAVLLISLLFFLQVGAYFTVFVNFSAYLSLFAAWVPIFVLYLSNRKKV